MPGRKRVHTSETQGVYSANFPSFEHKGVNPAGYCNGYRTCRVNKGRSTLFINGNAVIMMAGDLRKHEVSEDHKTAVDKARTSSGRVPWTRNPAAHVVEGAPSMLQLLILCALWMV